MLNQKGRVAIPAPILDALGLLPEAEVVISLTNAGVLIKPQNIAPSFSTYDDGFAVVATNPCQERI